MFTRNKQILRFIGWFFLMNTLIFWLIGSGYLASILSSSTLFHNAIADYSRWYGKIIIVVFTVLNFLSFMMLLAFMPAVFVGLLAIVAPYMRLIWFVSIITATLSVICLIVDVNIYSMFKFHLNLTVLSLIFSRHWQDVFDFSHHELVTIIGVISLVMSIECGLAYVVWKKIILPSRFHVGKIIAMTFSFCIVYSYFFLMLSMGQHNNLFIQQGPNLPLFNQFLSYTIPEKDAADTLQRLSEQHYTQAIFSHDTLNYPHHPMQCRSPTKPYNIIFIMVDSLRADGLNDMPAVTLLGKQSWQFLQHMSGGNSTQAGLFSLFYSIPSSYWTAALEQKKSPVFINLLLKYGYDMRVFWSSEMLSPPMDKALFRGVTNLAVEGAPGEDVGARDRSITQQAIQFLTSNHHGKPFFLNLFYDAPHGFCSEQTFPAVHQPIAQNCSRMTMNNTSDPRPTYNRYLNAVTFVDHEIEKIINTIEKQGYLNNSIVIFTSDHGQEFNDNQQNYWGHCSNYTKTQVHVPLIIHWPGEPARTLDYVTSGYDLMPTIIQRLFSCNNNVSDYSIGQDLLQHDNRRPYILSGSYVNMGIIEPNRLTTLQASGGISITTPTASPLPDAKPDMAIFNQVLKLMRMYYVKG